MTAIHQPQPAVNQNTLPWMMHMIEAFYDNVWTRKKGLSVKSSYGDQNSFFF